MFARTAHNEIIQIVDIFRANIIDVAPSSLIVEVTGDTDKIDSLYNLLKRFGVKELARTGRIAMARGAGAVKVEEEQTPEVQTPKAKKTKPAQ